MPKTPKKTKVPHVSRSGLFEIKKYGFLPPKRTESRFLKGTKKFATTRKVLGLGTVEVVPSWTRWAVLCDIKKCPCRHYSTRSAAKKQFPGCTPVRILITLLD